jgi:DNA-binding GntR family transcriptional regulator
MSVITRIETSPDLVEQVHTRLLEAICDGSLEAGARLTQEELAETLNVSRQPVLQALRILKNDGFVMDTGRRGLVVAPLEAAMIGRIYEVRSALDGLAARLAAERGARIDVAVVEAGRKAARGGNLAAMIDADMAFHQAIYDASGNPLIFESAGRHWQHIRRAMGAVLRSLGSRAVVWDEHAAILKAINGGDAARAERLARGHGEQAGRNLAAKLEQHAPPNKLQSGDNK